MMSTGRPAPTSSDLAMTPSCPTGLGSGVTAVRVLINLSPPLVGDLLARLVREQGTDPEIEVSTDAASDGADILVTSEPVGTESATTVIVLDDPIAPGTATVHVHGRIEAIDVIDLDAIATVVHDLCE